MRFFGYDLETYLDTFLFSGKFIGEQEIFTFEISDRKNQKDELLRFLSHLQMTPDLYMYGYNNLGFDWPILEDLIKNPYIFDAKRAYLLAQEIITKQEYGFTNTYYKNRTIKQIDLVKINHFDNKAKRTSLKALQFAMRSESVEDLPFDFNKPLTSEQKDKLIAYNIHDLLETEKFFFKCKHLIDMRFELLDKDVLSGDVLNYSDVKIGTEYLLKRIGRTKCYDGKNPKKTFRAEIQLKNIILPKIYYRTESFDQVLTWFKSQTLWMSKEERPKLQAKLSELDFQFGIGGVHASVENKVYESNETHVIKDVDVSGMYPAVAIANEFAPAHLGKDFVIALKQLNQDRKQYPKGTAMNLVLKLANNGAIGNSNNPFSYLYDPAFNFSITVNGQLQLIQLAELLSLIPGVKLIQANTDGITAYVPRDKEYLFNLWCKHWEEETKLKLEHVDYKKFWIRDVNNYLALGMNGEIKRKGAYWYPIKEEDYQGSSGSNWSKDFSMMCVQKAIEQVLINGCTSRQAILCMTDPFDFMLRYKTPSGAKVYIGDEPQQRTVRYYVSKSGEPMYKKSKPKGKVGDYKRKNGISDSEYHSIKSQIPEGVWDERIHTKNKSKYVEVVTNIESGRLIKQCNHVKDFNWSDVDFDYYINEVNKLIIGAPNV